MRLIKKVIIKYYHKKLKISRIKINLEITIKKKTISNCSCIQLGTFKKGIYKNKNKMYRKL